ncbi:MAG TPA: PLP-dependent aminotransferase family protein [Opitutaceae bacterium]|nr:PLP-dependent aminotransferase family protein [Opitutaceae bacterium]
MIQALPAAAERAKPPAAGRPRPPATVPVPSAAPVPAAKPAALPLYAELADSLQALIEQGTLRPGARVPSVRTMSRQRNVSIATVLQAYTTLENRGYLEARPQSGYYVKPQLACFCPEPRMARPMAKPSFVGVNDLTAEVMERSIEPDYVPFGAACPHYSLFPNKKLARILGSVARRDPSLVGRFSMNWGYEPLQREIARRYLSAGCPLPHDELVVTIGCEEALNLALRSVTRPGDTVALETPSYFGFLEIIQSLGLKALEIPTGPREGMCLDELRDALEHNDVKAVLVMPSFQNPLGSLMPDDKKRRFYELLCEYDLPAIEDDVYGDIHFGDVRPKPLKAWDRDGRVLLCSSFGKTLAPGFRIGWIAPGRYLERVRRLKFTSTLGTPVVLQKTLTEFLRDGGYDHHLRSIRRAYHQQMHLFSQAMQRYFPEGTRLSRPQGGAVIWVEFPARVDTLRLYQDALQHRINTAPGALFTVKDRYRNCLRMNAAIPWTDELDAALRKLGELVARQLG